MPAVHLIILRVCNNLLAEGNVQLSWNTLKGHRRRLILDIQYSGNSAQGGDLKWLSSVFAMGKGERKETERIIVL